VKGGLKLPCKEKHLKEDMTVIVTDSMARHSKTTDADKGDAPEKFLCSEIYRKMTWTCRIMLHFSRMKGKINLIEK